MEKYIHCTHKTEQRERSFPWVIPTGFSKAGWSYMLETTQERISDPSLAAAAGLVLLLFFSPPFFPFRIYREYLLNNRQQTTSTVLQRMQKPNHVIATMATVGRASLRLKFPFFLCTFFLYGGELLIRFLHVPAHAQLSLCVVLLFFIVFQLNTTKHEEKE